MGGREAFSEPGAADEHLNLRDVAGLEALMRIKGMGPQKALAVAEHVGSTETLASVPEGQLDALVGKGPADALRARPIELASPDLPDGIWKVGYFDRRYPERLRSLSSPPPVLWGKGTLSVGPTVAVVGSRDATEWSLRTARLVAESAIANGFAVVSGLALGVDTAAHEGCLDAGGATIAVLGNGVDKPYPAVNRQLAERIVANDGCLLAEVPPATRVSGHALVARDRLQAGLSLATVIVQSGIPGGTLHTARFTIEQGRVLAVSLPVSDRMEPRKESAYAGNFALASPQGCDPEVLGFTGKTGSMISNKKPVADVILRTVEDLPLLWAKLVDGA